MILLKGMAVILGAIYIIFMLEFSGFKSLESLVSLMRLHRKVSKSRETFKVRDFANTIITDAQKNVEKK